MGRLPVAALAALAALAVVGGLFTTAVPALAARPPISSCLLVRDPQGDATSPGTMDRRTHALPNASSLDLLTAEILSNRSQLIAVLHVADLKHLRDDAPAGASYTISFAADEAFVLVVTATPTATGVRLHRTTEPQAVLADARVDVLVDPLRSQVRIVADLGGFGGALRSGTVLEAFRVTANRYYGPYLEGVVPPTIVNGRPADRPGLDMTADDATPTVRYAVGRSGCVRGG